MQILAVGETVVLRRQVTDPDSGETHPETFKLTLDEAVRLADARQYGKDLDIAIRTAKSNGAIERSRRIVTLENELARLKGLA